MPHNDGEVRVEITGDSSKIKKELKETESAVKNTADAISEMTDALKDASGATEGLSSIAKEAESLAKSVSEASEETKKLGENVSKPVVIPNIGEQLEKNISAVLQTASKKTEKLIKINNSLELNPGNTELITQKYAVLSKELDVTQTKLSDLKKVQNQVEILFTNGKISTEKYEAYRREIIDTEGAFRDLVTAQSKIAASGDEIKNVTSATDDLSDSIENAGQKTVTFGDLLKANLLSDYIQKSISKLSDSFMGFIKQGVTLASDLQEVQNVVDTTFGDGAEQIYKWSDAAAESFGMSSLQAQNFNGILGAMLKSMGLTDDSVRTMSMDMVGLAGDMASFYNLDVETAFEKIRSGISGETEPLKQLGINMSVANLEAYALSQGIETAYDKMSQSEQAILRYNYLMTQTADAQGDFAKTSDSFANQQRILQLQTENLSASLGAKLLPSLNSVLVTANEKLPKLENTAENIGKLIGNITEFAIDNHEVILSLITAYGTFYGVMKAGNAINTAVTAIKSLTTATQAAETAQKGMNAAAAANPYVLLASAIAAVTVGFISLASAAGEASKELRETAEESVRAYEEQTEKVAGLEKELDAVNTKIAEIQSKGKLNLTDTDELTRLQVQNDKLSTQLEIEKEILETKRQQAAVDLNKAVTTDDSNQKGSIANVEYLIGKYEQTQQYINSTKKELDNAVKYGNETLAEQHRTSIENFEQEAREYKFQILEETAALNELAENLGDTEVYSEETAAAIDGLNQKVADMFDISTENTVDKQIEATNAYAQYMQSEGERQLVEDQQRRADDLADYENNLKAKREALDNDLALRRISEEQYYEKLGEYLAENRNLSSKEYFAALEDYEDYLDKKQTETEKAAKAEAETVEKYAKEQQEAEKKRIDDSVTALKDRLEADKNYTEEMYYNDLETLISTLDKESDLYKKYNSEILKGRRDLADAAEKEAQQEAEKLLSEQEKTVEKSLSNILKHFQDAYNELEKKRENYKKKLLSIGGDIFSVDEIEKPDGTKVKQYAVKNIDKQIKAMQDYHKNIAKLKQQGASSALLEELTSLSDSDSQEFAKYLSGMSAAEFSKINEAYAEKQRIADELSKELYADEYKDIADGINMALDEVSAGAADKGKTAAESYAKAFRNELLKHSEDFYPLLDDEKYQKWFENSSNPQKFFNSSDVGKLMKMFTGVDFTDIAAQIKATVRAEQARYSAAAYTAPISSPSVVISASENKKKSDIDTLLEKLNKPIQLVLDGRVIAETVIKYQGELTRRIGG